MSRIDEFDERELRWQLANLGVSAKAEAGVAQLRALLLDVGWTYQVNKDAAHKRFGEAFYFKLGDQTSQYKRPAVGENGLGLACFDVRSQLLHFGVPAATVASATNEQCLASLAGIGWRQYRHHKQGEKNFGRVFYYHAERNASQFGRPEVGDNGMDIAKNDTKECTDEPSHHKVATGAALPQPQPLKATASALVRKRDVLPDSDEDLDVGLSDAHVRTVPPRSVTRSETLELGQPAAELGAHLGALLYSENQQLHKEVRLPRTFGFKFGFGLGRACLGLPASVFLQSVCGVLSGIVRHGRSAQECHGPRRCTFDPIVDTFRVPFCILH